jgi:glycosyltransferase involved in cell wall biosynthesis
MKVTLLNTYQWSGGASVACNRLLQALNKNGTPTRLLVQEQVKPDKQVEGLAQTGFGKKLIFGRFALDRLLFWFREKDKTVRFKFTPAHVGIDISRHPVVQEADILHLHWVYFGFLSIQSLKKLVRLNKPIVWTLHDMWAFTGGCFYSGECTHYQLHCHHCPFLKHPHEKDLSYQVFEQKLALLKKAPITFVTCSQWLAGLAKQSTLLQNFRIEAIPNPIDTQIYQPIPRPSARQQLNLPLDKKLILFGALNTSDARKGFTYLAQALSQLKEKYPQTFDEVELVIFGKANKGVLAQLPYRVHDFGTISGNAALVNTYNACNLMVLPSLEDNLPNTIMEAMACGTAVVAFRTGGIPEMIDHGQNGYLAQYRSAEDLAEGIHAMLYLSDETTLREKAREKVVQAYTEEKIASAYTQLYTSLLS